MLSAAKHLCSSSWAAEFKRQLRRFFAQFILNGQSEILRFAQNDSEGLRMTGEKLSMTGLDLITPSEPLRKSGGRAGFKI
jgi:hypothetical protein